MPNRISPQELRSRATEYARRASVAQDSSVESAFRRFARHCLTRAEELEGATAARETALPDEKLP